MTAISRIAMVFTLILPSLFYLACKLLFLPVIILMRNFKDYIPKIRIAIPENAIIPPAMAWIYFSKKAVFIVDNPFRPA